MKLSATPFSALVLLVTILLVCEIETESTNFYWETTTNWEEQTTFTPTTTACDLQENIWNCQRKNGICREFWSNPNGFYCECEHGMSLPSSGHEICPEKSRTCDLVENINACYWKNGTCKEDSWYPNEFVCECEFGKPVHPWGDQRCPEKNRTCDLVENINACYWKNGTCKEDSWNPVEFVCECELGNPVYPWGSQRCPKSVCELPDYKYFCASRNGTCKAVGTRNFVCECEHGKPITESWQRCPANACDVPENIQICQKKNGSCKDDVVSLNKFVCECQHGSDVHANGSQKCADEVGPAELNIDISGSIKIKITKGLHWVWNSVKGLFC